MTKYIFTNEQTQEIIRLYQEELYSQTFIGKKFGVDRAVIKRVLLENGIELRAHNHKYYANYDIFSKIDTAEKAYWLGFIAADGYVTTPRTTAGRIIGINISRKDKEILNKFIKFLDSNIPIMDHVQTQGFSNNSKMSKVTVNSTKMALDLEEKGVTSQKSLTLKPPHIDEKFYLPFILGYFDGDGSIFKTKQSNNYCISFCGTKELLEWIDNILNIGNPLSKRHNDDKNNYNIRCGGTNKPYQIMKRLYDSSPVHLERKYKIFLELEREIIEVPQIWEDL